MGGAGSWRDQGSGPTAREIVRSGGALGHPFVCVCVYMQGCLYLQLKWGCDPGGSYVHVPATGETGIQGQLLSRVTVSAQLQELSTTYMGVCIHIYIH